MKKIDQRRKSSAFISIRYSTFIQTVRDFEPKFENFYDFLNGVGGLISMWVGINVITLFDLSAGFLTRLRRLCC